MRCCRWRSAPAGRGWTGRNRNAGAGNRWRCCRIRNRYGGPVPVPVPGLPELVPVLRRGRSRGSVRNQHRSRPPRPQGPRPPRTGPRETTCDAAHTLTPDPTPAIQEAPRPRRPGTPSTGTGDGPQPSPSPVSLKPVWPKRRLKTKHNGRPTPVPRDPLRRYQVPRIVNTRDTGDAGASPRERRRT